MERWPSGRRRSPAKRVYLTRVSRVRIPPSPPNSLGHSKIAQAHSTQRKRRIFNKPEPFLIKKTACKPYRLQAVFLSFSLFATFIKVALFYRKRKTMGQLTTTPMEPNFPPGPVRCPFFTFPRMSNSSVSLERYPFCMAASVQT